MAAVYAAWQLQRQLLRARHSPIKEILVLNADADWGGRVHTVYDAKGTALYEAGAARFFASHTHLVEVLHHFQHTREKGEWYPIQADTTQYAGLRKEDGVPVTYAWVHKTFRRLVARLRRRAQRHRDLHTVTLRQALLDTKLITAANLKVLFRSSGYPHVLDGNAEAGVEICEQDYVRNQHYFILTCGLQTLVHEMMAECAQVGDDGGPRVHFQKQTRVTAIGAPPLPRAADGGRVVTYATAKDDSEKTVRAALVVCAVPPRAMRHIRLDDAEDQRHVDAASRAVVGVPLLRQFSWYKTSDVSKAFYPKLVTNSAIQRQYVGAHGIVQTSYTSGPRARWWHSLSNQEQQKRLRAYQKQQGALMKDARTPPKASKHRAHFWEDGIHMWKPGDQPNGARAQQLHRECHGLWLCGEAYSEHKRWIESALASAHMVVDAVMRQMRNAVVATRRRRQQRAMWSMRRRVI